MPNLVLEKNDQTFRFELHEEKSVTRGKYITVPFNGREYYARYGDTSTPLKIEKGGLTYYIQYEPVEFVSYSWGRNGRDDSDYNENVFLPKGEYRITYTFKSRYNDGTSETSSGTFSMNASQEVRMEIEYKHSGYDHMIWVTIPGAYKWYENRTCSDITFIIERIGE